MTLAIIVLLYKEFLVVSFDPILASTLRLPVEALRNLMLILLALAIVVSCRRWASAWSRRCW